MALKKIPNRGAVRFLLLLTAPEEKLVQAVALLPFPTVLNPVPPCGAVTDVCFATKLMRPSWAVRGLGAAGDGARGKMCDTLLDPSVLTVDLIAEMHRHALPHPQTPAMH